MALRLIRVNEYAPNDFINATSLNAEFDQIIDRINSPAHSHQPLWNFTPALSVSTVFPIFSCPASTKISVSQFMVYYTDGTTGKYHIGFKKNGNDMGIDVHITPNNTSPGRDKTFSFSTIALTAGDTLQAYVISEKNPDWVNVTIQLCTIADWFIPVSSGLDDPATRTATFTKRMEMTDAEVVLEDEVNNVKAYWNAIRFNYLHAFFFSGEPTTTTRIGVFVVPEKWVGSAECVLAHVSFQNGTAGDSTAIGVYVNTVLQTTLTLSSASVAGTVEDTVESMLVSAGDVIELRLTDDSAAHEDITIQLDFELELIGGYTRTIADFDGVAESGEFEQEIDSLCGYFNTAVSSQLLVTYWEDPAGADRERILMLPSNVTGINLLNAYGWFVGGSASGDTNFSIKKNNVVIATFGFSGAGDPIETLKSTAINVNAESSDKLYLIPGTVSGSQTQITIVLEVNAELF